jgi:hypothetical protein
MEDKLVGRHSVMVRNAIHYLVCVNSFANAAFLPADASLGVNNGSTESQRDEAAN